MNTHIDALAEEILSANKPLPDALLSVFRQSLEQYANEAWAADGMKEVTLTDGTCRQLYVSSSSLTELFRSWSAPAIFISAKSGKELSPYRKLWDTAVTAVGEGTVEPVLQSEGGRNRFLGVDPESGVLSSVGWTSGKWVQWRQFHLESLRHNFPNAKYEISGTKLVADLTKGLFDCAVEQNNQYGHVDTLVTVRIARHDVGILLGRIATCISSVHHKGNVHGDLKPSNILLCAEGPVLIDAFDIAVGRRAPGWTPDWSAPEQVLGSEVCCASDVYPLGRMVADLLGGCMVGEVRKFKTRPTADGRDEFDIFYNPLIHIGNSEVVSSKGLWAWQAFVRDCLRFETSERPEDAAVFYARLSRSPQ